MVIRVDEWTIFTGWTKPTGLAKIFLTRMLTRDLYALADLFVNSTVQTANKNGTDQTVDNENMQTFNVSSNVNVNKIEGRPNKIVVI